MGTKMGPSIASMFVGYLEELMFAQYNLTIPLLYKRYINDIVGAATCTRQELQTFIDFVANFHPSLKFTHVIYDTAVTFLDLQLSGREKSIKSDIHFKDTDSHSYLLYHSSHPPSCKNTIPYSQLLRARRICTDDEDFLEVSKEIKDFFMEQKYPSHVNEAANDRMENVDRPAALQPSQSRQSDRIPLIGFAVPSFNLPHSSYHLTKLQNSHDWPQH